MTEGTIVLLVIWLTCTIYATRTKDGIAMLIPAIATVAWALSRSAR